MNTFANYTLVINTKKQSIFVHHALYGSDFWLRQCLYSQYGKQLTWGKEDNWYGINRLRKSVYRYWL